MVGQQTEADQRVTKVDYEDKIWVSRCGGGTSNSTCPAIAERYIRRYVT